MKFTIAVIVLAVFLRPVLPVVGYIINYDYIVKELCENRTKPELHCNGKCQLMKEMAKASENEKPVQQKKSACAEVEILFCQQPVIIALAHFSPSISTEVKNRYSNLYSFLPSVSLYHPPTTV